MLRPAADADHGGEAVGDHEAVAESVQSKREKAKRKKVRGGAISLASVCAS